ATGTHVSVGAEAMALPLLLLVGGIRLMREPADQARRGRGLVGWSCLLVATAGLLHLGKHEPTARADLERAGGWVGRGVGGGLAVGVTPSVAIALLVLLGLFGLLVVTATPVNKVPARLLAIWRYLVGAPTPSPVEGELLSPEEDEAPGRRSLNRGSARR